MIGDGIPSDPKQRAAWLAAFRKERTCASSRALVDVIATACEGLADVGLERHQRLWARFTELEASTTGETRKLVREVRAMVADIVTGEQLRPRLKVIGELMSRAIAADKHNETLETQKIREEAERHRRAQSRLAGLH